MVEASSSGNAGLDNCTNEHRREKARCIAPSKGEALTGREIGLFPGLRDGRGFFALGQFDPQWLKQSLEWLQFRPRNRAGSAVGRHREPRFNGPKLVIGPATHGLVRLSQL